VLRAPETWCQTPDSVKSSYVEQFGNRLLQYPEITSISACHFVPGAEVMRHLDNLKLQGTENAQEQLSVPINFIDDHYFETLGIPRLAGHGFREDFRMDRNCVIMNESAMRSLGLKDPESAVSNILNQSNRELRIIAVVKDHHHLGIKNEISPMVYFHRYAYDFGFILVKTQGPVKKAIQIIQRYWEEEFPIALFNYHPFDDFYNQQYKPEFRLRNSMLFFTLVAIILACVGLFSLQKYSLNTRIKEISIRRTLGASIRVIMISLLVEFLLLVALSVVIAFFLSYLTVDQWLQNFAYRTNIF
jgi:putative ABC transport system permease protein